ncbi:MAG: PQQ-binding-like beta-propeller repeat protein [Candidatus Hydrogenedentes bacterium]|nr:PQQ-binding-like beta-propeller repeat protein [Candidatus Hydrogenedentota bacterium]
MPKRFNAVIPLLTALYLSAYMSISVKAEIKASSETVNLFDRSNLMAWCIVPFDAKKRGPEARAEMLARMGIFKFAYDWRAEHIPTFDEELDTLKRWNIELSAFWFPGALNDEAKTILDVLKRHNAKTELWVSQGYGDVQCTPEEHKQRVEAAVAALRPIVDAAAEIGCKVGLYNHGGWFGEPENQIEILKALNAPNVGLVYNLHHGHPHLDRFPELLKAMMPYLYCVNLNGMTKDGEAKGEKIMPLGNGELDLALLRTIRDSGYKGPIGVLGHTMDDAEETLLDNLDGLDWLVPQLDGAPPKGPRPPLRVGAKNAAYGVPSISDKFGLAMHGSMLEPVKDEYRIAPITIECLAKLNSKAGYNILVASDTKASGAHWEVFTEAGNGQLAFYTPGLEPDHTRTSKDICDGKWHHVAVQYDKNKIAIYIDGEKSMEQPVQSKGMPAQPAGLGIGRLVEGGFFCDGDIDDVRISRGIRAVENSSAPATKDDTTIVLWNFDTLVTSRVTARAEIEDPARRAALPEFQIIPAANDAALAPAQDLASNYYGTWGRSHGGNTNARFAPSTQITKANVAQLKKAWEYRSGDGPANVQCNPIVVDGVMYAPTSGQHIVAVDATNGNEVWRFKPGGQPAFRGLTYCAGAGEMSPRLLFCSGDALWSLDPKSGKPSDDFGDHGKVVIGEVRIAPAVFQNAIILAKYSRDVSAYDLKTGKELWTFHTIPQDGEYARDTWTDPEEGANCWGGIALDDQRGMVFVSTGSPKPNFAGNTHTGQNLFANCVIALDALTGKRLWHFQELRHDIWDLDVPAPPILVSLERNGKKVDAVAQFTKIGNTLVLDRLTGESLFPIRLRRAPVSTVPGERTWPYQPDVELPQPFARQVFTLDDVTDRTDNARAHVMSQLASASLGWYQPMIENKPVALYGFHGGAEWTGGCYDPNTGRVYVSSNHVPWIVTLFRPDDVVRDPSAPKTKGQEIYEANCLRCHGPDRYGVGTNPPLQGLSRRMKDDDARNQIRNGKNIMPAFPSFTDDEVNAVLDFIFLRDVPESAKRPANEGGVPRFTHNGYPRLSDDEGYPGCKPPYGTLNCIDLASGKLAWQVPLGIYPDLAIWGDDDTGAENFGGPSITASGIIFCAGAADLKIRAFDAENGAVLWEGDLPFGGYAPPTIYEADGKQYVVIAASGGGKLGTQTGDAYVAFSL